MRVLDLTRFVAGPYCTMLLADQGADVVKVEPLEGEETRALGPMVAGVTERELSTYFLRFNRSKRSLALDLRGDAGRQILRTLLRHVDVLVENFRPGVLERMGLDWTTLEQLNPRLIYCTLTGFGYEDSPLRERGAFTPIVEGMAGAVGYRTLDEPPYIAAYPVGDLFPASLASAAIGMALYRRERDGRGARVDLAMYDAMISMNERALGVSAMTGRNSWPGLRADIGSAPSGAFRAQDGFVTMAVVGEKIWQRFCEVIERPDWAADPSLSSGPQRAARSETVVTPGIEDWLRDKTRAEAVRRLTEGGIPAAAVSRPLEVLEAEQAVARGMIVRYPAFGHEATVTGNPMRFAGEARRAAGPAPEIGEHTTAVLREWAGLPAAEVAALIAAGVARQHGGPSR